MSQSPPLPIAVGRFKQLAQRSNEIWQGGLVRLPAWVDNQQDPDGPPSRPIGALWVSVRTGLVHMSLPPDGTSASPDLALRALFEFGLKESKSLNGRPTTVEVRDESVKTALSHALSGLNTSVVLVDDLPAVDDALRQFEVAAGDGRRLPGMLEETGVTVGQLRAFADAAALFYRAEPWRHLTNEDLIVVEVSEFPRGLRNFVVLGNGGQQFGLAFFESRKAFERLYDETRRAPPRHAFGVTFGPIDDLPFADVDAWEDLALPVADARAYPLAADLRSDGTMRRLDAKEVAATEALLRALAQTTEDQLDLGSWQQSVQTFRGAMTVELTLPLLIEDEQEPPLGPRLGVMPRIAERSSARLARFLEDQSFESLDEANAALEGARKDGLFDPPADVASGRPLTPLEHAQELAYDAMEATGRLKIKLARRALALSADCADAHVVLGEAASNPEAARDWYQQAIDAGARALGHNFVALVGQFWGHLETRPYMRARLALAQALRELGRDDEAIGHYRELLRLNPNDNQGVRYLLLPALLESGHDDEAGRLLDTYDDDIQATWPYAQALKIFRAAGDGPLARATLTKAMRVNVHVVKYLLDPDAMPFDAPAHFSLGSKDEAAYVAEGLQAAFNQTPGALDWLRQNAVRAGRRRPARTSAKGSRRC